MFVLFLFSYFAFDKLSILINIKQMKKVFFVLLLLGCITSISAQRTEYPRPQFERSEWINLNGEWTYKFDFGNSGVAQKLQQSKGFNNKIMVPFCPESKLSGVEYKDFINSMWYHRLLNIPASWSGRRVMLNFGAVYYEAEVFIDGEFVGRHFGGTSSFAFDITPYLKGNGQHHLNVHVSNNLQSMMQPAGKLSLQYNSHDCDYTRCTGIWQTVWIEPVAKEALRSVQTITDIDQSRLIVNPRYYALDGAKLKVTVKDGSKIIAQQTVVASENTSAVLTIKNLKLWSPESPFLYDVTYEVYNKDNKCVDKVASYVGMRKIHIEGTKLYLNNSPLYLRMVLDQGFYPDGIWTAPSDADLKTDIQLAMSCGFNGARLHQKVFEERFHYWADKLGYLTCGESSSWGLDYNLSQAARVFVPEWIEIVERDRNHPSIVMWVPNNEQNNVDRVNFPRYMQELYRITKLVDPTRPFHGNSGGMHFATDIYSKHEYGGDPISFRKGFYNEDKLQECYTSVPPIHIKLNTGSNFPDYNDGFDYIHYNYQMPYFLDEYGGISYSTKNDGWGYSSAGTAAEFYSKVKGLTDELLNAGYDICGYCYTQLTDVEQEQNGLFQYNRTPKFDVKELRKIFSRLPEMKKQPVNKNNKPQ